MNETDASERDVRLAIDREVELVMSAVYLVAGGGAPSVTVAGLRLTEPVIDIVQPIATQAGVVLEPLWAADESTCDVRVHRADPT